MFIENVYKCLLVNYGLLAKVLLISLKYILNHKLLKHQPYNKSQKLLKEHEIDNV